MDKEKEIPAAATVLTDERILVALGSITHEVPKRLPPGWLKFARAIESEVLAHASKGAAGFSESDIPADAPRAFAKRYSALLEENRKLKEQVNAQAGVRAEPAATARTAPAPLTGMINALRRITSLSNNDSATEWNVALNECKAALEDAPSAPMQAEQARAERYISISEEVEFQAALTDLCVHVKNFGAVSVEKVQAFIDAVDGCVTRKVATTPAQVPADRQKLIDSALSAAEKWADAEHMHAVNVGKGGAGNEAKCIKAEQAARDAIMALAAQVPAAEVRAQALEPARMNITESKEYLIKFMEQYFTDKTFHRYIRGGLDRATLAGDFAWQMARALRMILAQSSTADKANQGEQA